MTTSSGTGGDVDSGLFCPPGVPVRRWARAQAEAAAVPGAPGWYAVGSLGAVNVAAARAVFASPDPDEAPEELYRILVLDADDAGGWSINAGPYRYGYEAARVAQQVLVMANGFERWPAAEALDTDDVDADGHPALFDVDG